VCDVICTVRGYTDRNNIYKVETVKDSFVGVSGAPERVSRIFFLNLIIQQDQSIITNALEKSIKLFLNTVKLQKWNAFENEF